MKLNSKRRIIAVVSLFAILIIGFGCGAGTDIEVTTELCKQFNKYPVSFKITAPDDWNKIILGSPDLSVDNYLELQKKDENSKVEKSISIGYLQGGNPKCKNLMQPLAEQFIQSIKLFKGVEDKLYEDEFIKLKKYEAYSLIFKLNVTSNDPDFPGLKPGKYFLWVLMILNPEGPNGALGMVIEGLPENETDVVKFSRKTEAYKIINTLRF
ncbi:hypothetical protein KAU33_14520 [Candidatus Dependentiae bacterium]|nr:hypothetical protein [Candidatus Dependentiae bacterium]